MSAHEYTGPDPDCPIEHMRKRDAVCAIASEVGINQGAHEQLTKLTLNSLHFHLTGETHFSMRHYGTEHSSSLDAIRLDVAIHLANEGYDLESYLDDPDRQFRLSELREIARAVRSEEDQRPFMDGGRTA